MQEGKLKPVRSTQDRHMTTKKLFRDDFDTLIRLLSRDDVEISICTDSMQYESVDEFLIDRPTNVKSIKLTAWERVPEHNHTMLSIEVGWGFARIYLSQEDQLADTYTECKTFLRKCWPRSNALYSTFAGYGAYLLLLSSPWYIGRKFELAPRLEFQLDMGWTGLVIGAILLTSFSVRKLDLIRLTVVDLSQDRSDRGNLHKYIWRNLVRAAFVAIGAAIVWLYGPPQS